jgi:hypothetical protein
MAASIRSKSRTTTFLLRTIAEQFYGADHLDLMLATGYVANLLRNGRVVGYSIQRSRSR